MGKEAFKRAIINLGKEYEGSILPWEDFVLSKVDTLYAMAQEAEHETLDKFEARVEKFHEECKKFTSEFGEMMVENFFEYWSEPNKSRTKMRYEKQPTWETHRRMLTWSRNNFNKYNRNVEPERECMTADEALRKAGWIQ